MSQALAIAVQAAILAPILLAGYAILRVVYNLFLHPLRSYPGPLLARTTILTSQRQLIKGRTPIWMHALHEKYGPVVRYAPNELSFITAEAWKEIYGHKSHFPKDPVFYGKDSFGDPPGIIRADNVAHARIRKLVSHAFSDKALREQEGLLKGYVELLVKQLNSVVAATKEATEGGAVGAIDVVQYYNFTTFDIMADLTFGESLNLLQSSAYTPWLQAFFSHIKLVLIGSVIRAWPGADNFLNRFLPASAKEKRRLHMEHSITRINKRLATKTQRPDIWTYVMKGQEEEGKRLAETEMQSTGALFMIAGTETTATELSGLTFLLLKSPEKFRRLKEEVRSSFTTWEDMTIVKLSQLEYLNACIEEGLRVYPPVAINMPRRVPKGGATVAGKYLREGTAVCVTHWAAYHSSQNFKNPDTFAPERWLPEGQQEYAHDARDVLQPFSYGPRNCLGKNLAYHEMRLVLASIIWNFDLELIEGQDQWMNQENHILWNKHALMVKLTPIRK